MPFAHPQKKALYAEANEPPLKLRRIKLPLNYYIKLKANPDNPAYDCVFEPSFVNLFEEKPKETPTFGIRMSFASNDAKINLKDINDEPLATVSPPWILSEPTVDLSLSIFLKDQTSLERYKQLYLELCQKHPNSIKIFTDGSKSGNHVASAAVIGPNLKKMFRKEFLMDVPYLLLSFMVYYWLLI